MPFIQATERTLNAIRKADALKNTSSMKVEVGSNGRSPSMLYTPIYSSPQTIAAPTELWGEFFCRYKSDELGQRLEIGTLDHSGFSTSRAGYVYFSDGQSYISIPRNFYEFDLSTAWAGSILCCT